MFGNLMSNALIIELRNKGGLQINPFEIKNLQETQYRLSPMAIKYEKEGMKEPCIHDFSTKIPYLFQPREYALIIPNERIVLPDGIVGRFIPQSGLIEAGFGLFSGKLDPHYGENNEKIVFGIVNLRNRENKYYHESPLAYIQFFDIRGLPVIKPEPTPYDLNIREERIAEKLLGILGGLNK